MTKEVKDNLIKIYLQDIKDKDNLYKEHKYLSISIQKLTNVINY